MTGTALIDEIIPAACREAEIEGLALPVQRIEAKIAEIEQLRCGCARDIAEKEIAVGGLTGSAWLKRWKLNRRLTGLRDRLDALNQGLRSIAVALLVFQQAPGSRALAELTELLDSPGVTPT